MLKKIKRIVTLQSRIYSKRSEAIMREAGYRACNALLKNQEETVRRYSNRITELVLNVSEYIILIASADDEVGCMVAKALIPNPEKDWDSNHGGASLYAKGIVTKKGICNLIKMYRPEAVRELTKTNSLCVLILAHNTALVHPL